LVLFLKHNNWIVTERGFISPSRVLLTDLLLFYQHLCCESISLCVNNVSCVIRGKKKEIITRIYFKSGISLLGAMVTNKELESWVDSHAKLGPTSK